MESHGEKSGAGTGKRFTTLWFDDDLDGKIANKNDRRPVGAEAATSQMHDLYNNNNGDDDANIEAIWMRLTDSDGDPTADDLGKADLVSDEDVDKTVDNETTIAVEECPDGNKWVLSARHR